jgi:hypothetical protein
LQTDPAVAVNKTFRSNLNAISFRRQLAGKVDGDNHVQVWCTKLQLWRTRHLGAEIVIVVVEARDIDAHGIRVLHTVPKIQRQ